MLTDIRLLGHFEVLDGAGRPIAIPGHRQRSLLALLAVSFPRSVTVDRLVGQLWMEPPESHSDALRVVVSRLRQAIGSRMVETVGGGYKLNATSGATDIDRFHRHDRRGVQLLTLGDPAGAAEAFRQALSQWRGAPLSDFSDLEFAAETSRRLENERVDVAERLMDAELQAGRHHLVVADLTALAESHPVRERLWHLLMLALYRSGRQAEALRAFSRLRTHLAEALGVDPSPEVADLEERILLHDPSLTNPGSSDVVGLSGSGESQMVSFKPGDTIVEEGSDSTSVYWIEDGIVETYRIGPRSVEHVVDRLGRGQYFGELSALLRSSWSTSVRAVTPTTLSVLSLTGFQHRLVVERANEIDGAEPEEEPEELIRRGDYLRAYDAAMTMIDRGHADMRIRYLAVLALARVGATTLARQLFRALGLDTIDRTTIPSRLAEELAALLPRLDKDMAMRAHDEDRTRWARRSAGGYEAAYRDIGSSYLGTNAATMWLMAGDGVKARRIAHQVYEGLQVGDSYWDAVSKAECDLISGDVRGARTSLQRAGRAFGSDPTARSTTLRQLRVVCDLQGVDPAILEPILNGPVVHYCGHRITADEGGRLAPTEEGRIAAQLRKHLEEVGATVGFGSLAAGADILAAEALLHMGADLHVVLPFDRDEFVRASVATAGDAWVPRFERCLAMAADIRFTSTAEHLDDPVFFDFCSQIAMGDALARAEALQTDAVQMAVWDGKSHGGPTGTAIDIERWRRTGNRSVVIDAGEATLPTPAIVLPGKHRICGFVSADFTGFSSLSNAQALGFHEMMTETMWPVVSTYRDKLLSGRTWGSGMDLAFGDIPTAASCALALQTEVEQIDFGEVGLDAICGLTVAAHAAPVLEGWDPIGETPTFYGNGFRGVPRLSGRIAEGKVYVTHPFASLASLASPGTFETVFVGTGPTAADSGLVSLYSLRYRDGARLRRPRRGMGT